MAKKRKTTGSLRSRKNARALVKRMVSAPDLTALVAPPVAITRARAIELAAHAGLDNAAKLHKGKTSAEMVVDALTLLGVLTIADVEATAVAPTAPAAPPRVIPPPEHQPRMWHWLATPVPSNPELRQVAMWANNAWLLVGSGQSFTPETAATAGWRYLGLIEQ